MRFTDLSIRQLETPTKGQKLYADDMLPGFFCRVSQGGTKSFLIVYGADRQFITLGRYPTVSLSQARTEAKTRLAELTLGRGKPNSISYEEAVKRFLADKRKARRATTVDGYERLLNRLKFKKPLGEITHEDAARKLDRISAPSEQAHVLVAAKTFWNWCIKRRLATENPFIGLTKPVYTPRDRVLSMEELVALWRATERDNSFHRILRYCILTAQRRGEVAQLKRHYITDGIVEMPPHTVKNNRPHFYPLGHMALQLLDRIPHAGEYYLNMGDEPFNNWGDATTELRKTLTIPHFTIHDIRRSVATHMASLGVMPHVIERILNHVTNQGSAVSLIYNRHRYLEEMADAFTLWEAHLTKVLASPTT